MTIYHTSPRTGGTARCRAIGACPYGATFGTSILKDGTTAFGTASPTWRDMKELPKGRSEERIVVDANGEVKNVWSVENSHMRPTSRVEEPVQKPSPTLKKEKGVQLPPEAFPDEFGKDENDVDNIDFGTDVHDGNSIHRAKDNDDEGGWAAHYVKLPEGAEFDDDGIGYIRASTNTAAATVEKPVVEEEPTVNNDISRLYQKEEDPDRTYEMRGVKDLEIEKLHMDNGYLADEHMKIVDEADEQGTGIARTYEYGTKKGVGKRYITMKDPNQYNGVFYGHDYSYTDILMDYGSGKDIFALNNYEQADAETTSIAKQYTAEINRKTFSNPTQEQYDNWFNGKTNENTFTIYTRPLSENTVKKALMNEWIQLQQFNGDDDMYTEEQMTWWKPGSWDEKWPGTA